MDSVCDHRILMKSRISGHVLSGAAYIGFRNLLQLRLQVCLFALKFCYFFFVFGFVFLGVYLSLLSSFRFLLFLCVFFSFAFLQTKRDPRSSLKRSLTPRDS